jgi:acyl carrier protein
MRPQLTEAEIYSVLTDLFREVFANDAIVLGPKTTARDIPEWDSAKLITIILLVEERFGFEMSSSEIDRLKSVGDLAGIVKTRER